MKTAREGVPLTDVLQYSLEALGYRDFHLDIIREGYVEPIGRIIIDRG